MMQISSEISPSPSINSYSNNNIAEIAARVVEELRSEEHYDEFYFKRGEDSKYPEEESSEGDNGGEGESCDIGENDVVEDEEFEFAFVTRDVDLSSPISADEIFLNGQIRPVYPVFNRDLFLEEKENVCRSSGTEEHAVIRLPLRKLFIEERETAVTMTRTSSSSSSEADELEGVPAETYCVWQPKDTTERRWKKSGSAGSNSKRWKLRDLMPRSHSDGSKDRFVLLSHSNSGRKKQNGDYVKTTVQGNGKAKSTAAFPPPMAVYKRDDGGERRRSYLPYRRELVGIFIKK